MKNSTRNKIDAAFLIIELISLIVNTFKKDKDDDKPRD